MHRSKLLFCTLFIGLACMLAPGKAVAVPSAGFSLHMEAAAGDESSTALDFYARYLFSPWYSGETLTLSPYVDLGGQVWMRSDHDIWGGTLAGGLRLDFSGDLVRPFLAGSFGGSLISRDKIGDKNLGCHFQFRSRFSAGLAFGERSRHSLEAVFTHYSNAGMSCHSSGYNTYGLAYGFRF